MTRSKFRYFLLFLLLTFSVSLFCAKEQSENPEGEEYEQYLASLPLYDEPISLPKERVYDSASLSWVPSSHVTGLNVLGLVPSAYIGVGWVRFDSIQENSALFEYSWGYRVFSFCNLAFSYQNQIMEVKDFSDKTWRLGRRQYKDNSKFALHALMFKGYIESPRVLRVDRFFITPYIAMGVGPGWVQRGIYGTSVGTWEGDLGVRFGAIHRISFISFMAGGKYIGWGNLGHSLVQYLGLRLNF